MNKKGKSITLLVVGSLLMIASIVFLLIKINVIKTNKVDNDDIGEIGTLASNKINVILDANGGMVSKKSLSIKKGTKIGSLPTPTRSGYTFNGWYSKKSGGSVVNSSTKFNKNTTIYAHWKIEIGISLNKKNLSIKVGDSDSLKVTMVVSNVFHDVKWTSSNPKVVTVNNNGVVKGIKEGTATITVSLDNVKKASCKVTVTSKNGDVSKITLNKTNLSLIVGKSEKLNATVIPSNAKNKTIIWTSGNPNIATVDKNGKVVAIKSGTVTITAKSNNGKIATCKVTVTSKTVNVSKVTLNKTKLSLLVGKNEKLTATVTPTNATNKTITWTSSNSKIASVDKNGKVVAIKSGTVTITAKSNNGKIATCTLVIKNSDAISSDGTINNKYFNIVAGEKVSKATALANTKAINAAVTYAHENGIKTIKLAKGTYVVANIVNKNDPILNTAIQLKSNMNFNLNGSTIKMYPNSDAQYSIVLIYKEKNVKVYNGTLEGDRKNHTCMNGKSILDEDKRVGPDAKTKKKCLDGSKGDGTHEWGMGVRVRDSSSVEIYSLTIKEMTGDGVIVGNDQSVFPIVTKNILVHNNEIYNCRRQGITIGRGENLKVYKNNIHNIKGTDPEAGIDVEPDGTKNYIIKTEIYDNKFSNNGVDFSSYNKLKRCTTKDEVNIIIHDNDFDCKKSHTVYLRESLRKSFTLKDNECQRIRYTGQDYVKCD